VSITHEEAARIAALARLRLDQATLDRFAAQMGDVLGYMELLGQVDTTGVEPLYGPAEEAPALREDAAGRTATRAEVLANAPDTDGVFFIVPRIV